MSRLYRAVKCSVSSDRLRVALSRLWEISVGVQPGAVEVRDDEVRGEAGQLQVFSEDHPGYLARVRVSACDDPATQVSVALLLSRAPPELTFSSGLSPTPGASHGNAGRLHCAVVRGADDEVGVAGDELNIRVPGRTSVSKYNSFQT